MKNNPETAEETVDYFLKEIILDVLREAKLRGERLLAVEICGQTGLSERQTHGFLSMLEESGRVLRIRLRGIQAFVWELSELEFAFLSKDSDSTGHHHRQSETSDQTLKGSADEWTEQDWELYIQDLAMLANPLFALYDWLLVNLDVEDPDYTQPFLELVDHLRKRGTPISNQVLEKAKQVAETNGDEEMAARFT